MRTRRRRCLVFATHTASNYLPRLARAARRVQGPRSSTFRKLEAETNTLVGTRSVPRPECRDRRSVSRRHAVGR